METYKGNINEFVDWTTGVNSATGNKMDEVSSDNPISGKSIRELIQKHLQTPFITEEDDVAGKIRFFSSEEAKNLWKTYSQSNIESEKELADDLVLYSMDTPATYKITGLEGSAFTRARYIIEGNQDSQNAVLSYTLGIEDSLGGSDSDIVTVTYTVKDSSQNITYNEGDQVETGVLKIKNIYQYLRSGDNEITIKASANNHHASTTKTFHIYLVTFQISSNFGGYYTGISNGISFSFDVAIKRSITNLPCTTRVYISEDGSVNHSTPAAEWKYTEQGSAPSKRIEISNIYQASTYNNPKKYRMIIKSQMNDIESQSTFESNVLVYEFQVSSNLGDLVNSFVNCAYSISDSNYNYTNQGTPILYGTQYVPFVLDWGYYTDAGESSSDVDWYIRTGQEGEYVYTPIVSILGVKGEKPTSLSFVPSVALSYEDDNSFLIAKINDNIVEEYPITIAENSINVTETGNYSLKLSAYGKTNQSDTKNQWVDSENNITTTFSVNVPFDNNNGWDNNSLMLKGTEMYATVNYCPFPETYNGNPYNLSSNGAAFEIDFKPEQVNSDDDIILTIGDTTKGYIAIRPTSAAFYENSSVPTIKTNFKAGERIKLCFIFNRYSEISNDSNLVFIVNNGILERAAVKGNAAINSNSGTIKIGGSRSGIRVYSIRAYRTDISPKQELDNYMFDNISDASLISRNDVYGNSSIITYSGMQGKQDIIIIEGDLSNILNNAQAKENATVNITRESNTDPSKNFTVTNCRIRNHGQSTLSYPITSMKIWLNKSNLFEETAQGTREEIVPDFICSSQQYLGLNKNRYIMKNGSIPSNKFVLQANYADSSGAHNGSLLRLIQDTWYNAKFGDNNEFKLRTAPQLFTSGAKITHNNIQLNEDGSWIEGVYNIPETDNDSYNANRVGKTWPEISGTLFPYTIRNSADSFPCTIFYRNTSTQDQELTLLGQYVFMDDKKSDYVYGERSIYYTSDPSDPFCLKTENRKKDTKANKVWDNNGVLQVEVVYPNSPLTSYNSKTIATSYELDENDNLIPSGEQHRFDDAYTTDSNGNTTSYYWEQHFELIYPDKEDIVDKNDKFSPTKFTETVTPFMNFINWITDVASLNGGTKLGATGSQARVTQAELNKFIAEAHDHLDLYKLAAYYIFFLRFGLVDSVERNAQLKTYDGQHWHYEPWDMDIALGCANNGVIAYEPPLTRDTIAGGTTYAFSGRTASQSNVLWDCLECWDYWANTIVPEVAQSLYEAGLTYDNVSKMFDEEYVGKWSETLYNESGHYKYIDATLNSKYRLYLNGARTSHRHWWLSKSMNYYDAKWSCGDFTKHSIQFRIGKPAASTGYNLIKITPTSNTFFKAQYGSKGDDIITTLGDGLTEATIAPGGEAVIDANVQLEDKQPCFIFGASSIQGLDLSGLLTNENNIMGQGYTDIAFEDSYDKVLGASIKTLKLGAPCTPNIYTNPNATSYVSNLTTGQNGITALTSDGEDALENLELLDVVGWYNKKTSQGVSGWISDLFSGTGYDRKNISTLYAMGCDMATEFSTSKAGNKFVDLRLPSTVSTLEFSNSSWEDISFWESTAITSTRSQYDKIDGIPASVNSISFKGSTAKNQCSLNMVLSWIDNIEAEIATAHPGYTTEELETALWQALSQKVLYAEQISWGTGTTKLYYKDVIRLSKFGNNGILYNLKGYVVISDITPLTAIQISELQNIFGSNVFNVGTTNSNLVVDQNLGFVRISASGETPSSVYIENDELYLREPQNAILSATSFKLKSSSITNVIVNDGMTFHQFENQKPQNTYLWTISQNEDDRSGLSKSYNSAELQLRNNGTIRLATSEGDFSNYSLYVNVYYIDGNQIKHDSVKINIIGVTYPSSYEFQFSRATSQPRPFLYTNTIGADIFGQSYISMATLPEAYILYNTNQKVEISLMPSGTYNATINSIEYYLSSDENNNTGYMNAATLADNDNQSYEIDVENGALVYTKDSQNGGITVKVAGNPPSTMRKYRLVARISIGGRSSQTFSLNIIVWDDNDVIISQNVSEGKYIGVTTLYKSNYSLTDFTGSVYKSHLLSLYGTLDFSQQQQKPASLLTQNGDSMFLYTKYITSVILDGCTAIPLTDISTSATELDFSNMQYMTSLSINGCSGLGNGLLDLSANPEITSIDTRGTTVGIKLVNSKVSSLQLGSPSAVSIINPTILGNSGTTFTIQDDQYLNNIKLEGCNISELHGFSLFNTLYN